MKAPELTVTKNDPDWSVVTCLFIPGKEKCLLTAVVGELSYSLQLPHQAASGGTAHSASGIHFQTPAPVSCMVAVN